MLTGAFAYTPEQRERLSALGMEVYFMQQERDALPLPAEEVDAVVCNGLFLSHPLPSFTRLKYVQLTSAGFDRVDVAEMRRRGIILHNARGVYSRPIAEWVLLRVLENLKHARLFLRKQDGKLWQKDREIKECAGRRAAVVGAGSVGREVAALLCALDFRVTGFDVCGGTVAHFDTIEPTDCLGEKIGDFDVVVLTAPLLPATFHLMDGEKLQKMRDGSLLVNVARGALIDEEALVETLLRRPALYAALDVFETEPLPQDSPLWTLENASLSPHNSFISDGNGARMFRVILDNLNAWLSLSENTK